VVGLRWLYRSSWSVRPTAPCTISLLPHTTTTTQTTNAYHASCDKLRALALAVDNHGQGLVGAARRARWGRRGQGVRRREGAHAFCAGGGFGFTRICECVWKGWALVRGRLGAIVSEHDFFCGWRDLPSRALFRLHARLLKV